ncbi:hypothetical protein ACEWY4_007581 [Coilia grayii]|uniref:Gypsy retrotransposon integrase-like protein 1 n=1 Tax=Coilia grayii TaxID=363190 RepID=A0ABD1KGZ2_9TELE
MEAITRRNSAGVPNPDHMVRDQFAENVRDGLLRRELKRSIRLNPESSFLTIRSEAVRWVEEGDHVGMPRTRAYSCDSRAQVTGVLQQGKKKHVAIQDQWDEGCERAFQGLKDRLVQAPVLGYANFSQPFILEIDASHAGLRAVLSQDQEGRRRPVAFASRGLHPLERNMSNYSSMKLELLALKWSVTDKFREYLLGNKFTPEITSVSEVVSGISVPPLLGKTNILDGRPSLAKCLATDDFPTRGPAELKLLQQADPSIGCFWGFWTRGEPPTREERENITPEVVEMVRQWGRICEREGVLYRLVYPPDGGHGVLQLLLAQALKAEVLRALHDNQGHQGCERTLGLVRQRCYWPNMKSAVEKWCRECSRCVVAKAVVPKVRTFPGTLLASQPLDIVAIDFTVLERATDGRENVLVVTDVFSKFSQAYPAADQRAGYSPYELMFGQKPHLPIDSLLGAPEEEESEDTMDDWVKVHQARLRSIYHSAQQHLEKAAAQRIHQQPEPNAVPLPVGSIVFRLNHVLGRNKIQDTWASTPYQVMRCLDDSGRVYAIRPINGNGVEKNVHRTELRLAPATYTPPTFPPMLSCKGTGPPASVVEEQGEEDQSVWIRSSPDRESGRPALTPGPEVQDCTETTVVFKYIETMSTGDEPHEPSMEEQLRLLREQVRQLQADNLRLRGTSSSPAEVSNTQPGVLLLLLGGGMAHRLRNGLRHH